MADVAFTLLSGRDSYEYRQMTVCSDRHSAIAALQRQAGGEARRVSSKTPRIGFVFAADAIAMARLLSLATIQPLVRSYLATAFGVTPDPVDAGEARSADSRFEVFVGQYVAASVLIDWGVRPSVLLGAGVGELVAACIGGMFSLDVARSVMTGSPVIGEATAPQIDVRSMRSGKRLTRDVVNALRYWQTTLEQPSSITGKGIFDTSDIDLLILFGGGNEPDLEMRCPCSAGVIPLCLDASSLYADLLNVAGRAWLAGASLVPDKFFVGQARRRLLLPTYPFERKRYWLAKTSPSKPTVSNLEQASKAPVTRPLNSRPELSTSYREPQTTLEWRIADAFALELGYERVGSDDDYLELGGDSLAAATLIERLKRDLQIELPVQLLFTEGTAARLAQVLEQKFDCDVSG